MKKIGTFLIVLSVLSLASSAQSKKTSEVGRKERLLAAENINLNAELAKNKKELEKQNKLLQQCKQDLEKRARQAAIDANEIKNLKINISQCRNELETLKKQFEQCQRMVDLTDVPALCKDKVDKQKKLLKECQKEKAAIEASANESSSFFMEKLPADLLNETNRLTEENKQLKAKIAELEKGSKDANEVPKE